MRYWDGMEWVVEIDLDLDDMNHIASEGSLRFERDGQVYYIRVTPDDEPEVLQRELFEPDHASLHEDRLKSSESEQVYAEKWKEENTRHAGLNRGFTALEWILCPTKQRYPRRALQHEATIAATLVQWFGTNCGGCFVRECEKEIEKRNLRRRDMRHEQWQLEFKPFPIPEKRDRVFELCSSALFEMNTGASEYRMKEILTNIVKIILFEHGAGVKSKGRRIEL